MYEINGMDAMDAAKEYQIRKEEDMRRFAEKEAFLAYCRRAGDE